MAAAFNISPVPVRLESCAIGWMVNTRTGECVAKPCGKWACAMCGPRNVRRLAARFRREGRKYNRFITLTLDGDASPTRENLRRMSRGWRKLYFSLKRQYGLADFAWVHEQSSRLRVHKHLVVRSKYIRQRRLSALALRAGLGRIVDIRVITGELGMRSYLTKYLTKDSARASWPRYARRVQHNLSPVPRRTEDRWIFEPRPRVPWRRHPEPELRIPEIPEEVALAPDLERAPMLPFARAPGPAPPRATAERAHQA